jgi:hypothetical protein
MNKKTKAVKKVPVEVPKVEEPKKTRRKRGEGNPENRKLKLYFNSDTQDAIVAYQQSDDRKTRENLYVKVILPAFSKLVENLINIHKFTSLHDSYDDLKNDCVNFLFEVIRKFDATRGSNAFSYFNVVAKNWLIIKTKQKILKMKRNVSLDDGAALSTAEQKMIEEYQLFPSPDAIDEDVNTSPQIISVLYEIKSKAKTENEALCIGSIITIFENIDDVDLLNKSAVLLYMRELSGLNPKQLTMTMQTIKKHYKRIRNEPEKSKPRIQQ